ncbi:AraC family transcriptional regulator [Mycobacterium sp.]|uniref:AraC family transcriptional regulator n=1 Tax=Mycobacterium sp. TaxID=1785 RepID=UPI002C4BDA3D|nr:AraC family transcriptional regulator [Mycobacterium sp.]HXB88159.1 AraC family transcriptional regulator [Mycobacterium sp.]
MIDTPSSTSRFMDPFDDVLATMDIENSRYIRVQSRAPWGISFHPRDAAHLMMIARGSCWLTMTSADSPVRLNTGDCYLMQPDCDFTLQHRLGDDVVSCERVLTDYDVTHGGEGELTEVIFGRFPVDTDVAQPLFARLPPHVRLDLDGPSCRAVKATFDLLAQATATGGIGTHLIVTRLADILFVQALRAVHASAIDGEAGWLSALHDPQMARAMRAMHTDIARRWTVDALAREAHMSRSAFAAAFKAKTGDTPLGYLDSWRMYRAKALLRDTSLSLQQIASQIGYQTGTALSRAFARHHGVAPGAWRRHHQTIRKDRG